MLQEAIREAGSADALRNLLEAEIGYRYQPRNVNAWAAGEAMPPGDALVAAMMVTRLDPRRLLADAFGNSDWLERESQERFGRLERILVDIARDLAKRQLIEPALLQELNALERTLSLPSLPTRPAEAPNGPKERGG